jgi:hypothetical protein
MLIGAPPQESEVMILRTAGSRKPPDRNKLGFKAKG